MKNQEVDTDERDGNTEIKDKARNVEKSENEATVIREFEEIIRSKKKNITWLAYQQGKNFF